MDEPIVLKRKKLVFEDNSIGLKSFLKFSLAKALNVYEINYNSTVLSLSEEAVHDIRVSMRRLIVILNFLSFNFKSIYALKIKKDIKKLFDRLSKLRDNQVIQLELSNYIEEFPFISQIITILQSKESSYIENIGRNLQNYSPNIYAGWIYFLLQEIDNMNFDFGFDLALDFVDFNYKNLLDSYSLINIHDPVSIHNTRIAFKKFRYSIEMLLPAYETKKKKVKILNQIQTLMGKIQDLSVLITELNSIQEDVDFEIRHLINKFNREFDQAINKFIENSNIIENIWLREEKLS